MNTELIPQLWSSVCFLAAGLIGALGSDLLSSLCTVFRGRFFRTASDFFLLVFCACLLFLTSVSIVQDTLRGYMLTMFVFGAAVWEKTAGKLLRFLLCRLLRAISRLFRASVRLLRRPPAWIKRHLVFRSKENFCKKNKKAGKSTSIFFANRLK